MKLSKNSWHYRLMNHFDTSVRYRDEVNLCPYARTVALLCVLCVATALFASIMGQGMLLVLMAITPWYEAPWHLRDSWEFGFLMVGCICWTVSFVFGSCYLCSLYFENPERKRRAIQKAALRAKQEPSLIRLWLKAAHDKICPTIDFE